MEQENDAFYIGWQPEAPRQYTRRMRITIVVLAVLVPLTGLTVVLNQRGFATSTFEFGVQTEIEGTLTLRPAPLLRIDRGRDTEGNPVYQYVLLVAPGKHGAGEMLKAMEAGLGYALEGRHIRLRGFLIYHDGKTLMEVDSIHDLNVSPDTPEVVSSIAYGQGTVVGEITDPKCLFGVMKPGSGKPHRSCAARCIAGGIPPVLKTTAQDGSVRYFLLAGSQGEALNHEVLPYVGDQVAICGEIRRIGEWAVLYKHAAKDITLVSHGQHLPESLCR